MLPLKLKVEEMETVWGMNSRLLSYDVVVWKRDCGTLFYSANFSKKKRHLHTRVEMKDKEPRYGEAVNKYPKRISLVGLM